jgi:HAD superfamily hydrolase (TIGR01484 family)
MRFQALATDYDGTLATGGTVGEQTFSALARFRKSGRKVLLVTGREMPDLMKTCPRLDAFDLIVAENGAMLYEPATEKETLLAAAPPKEFVDLLAHRKVTPMSLGRVIVATWQPHETVVLQTIRDLGLELQVIFNKGAVMILPPGVNKATGLAAALVQLKISPHNVVAVGDAENDHALCHSCGASAAVANALPALKDAVCIRLQNHHGAGVEELIDLVLRDDLASLLPPEPAAIATDATQVLAAATAATDNSYGAASENGAPLLRGTDVPL